LFSRKEEPCATFHACLAVETELDKRRAAGIIVVAAIKMGPDLLGHGTDLADRGLRRGCQEGRVVAVGAGCDQSERHPRSVGGHRAFAALLAAVDRGAAGDLAAAGSLVMHPSTGMSASCKPMSWGSRALNSLQIGSSRHDGTAGTDSPGSSALTPGTITAVRACLLPREPRDPHH
jgi:hypothetical protein